MSSSSNLDRQRARLAKATAEFWRGGDGPSHGEIDDAFAIAGVSPIGSSKRDRVADAVRSVRDEQLFTLLDELVQLLERWSLPGADEEDVKRLRSALRPYGFSLTEEYELRSAVHPTYDHLPDLPALREHVDRLQRALKDDDGAQLLGSTKELLESTAKVVLIRVGQPAPSKFPALLTAAFEALHLHPKSNPSSGRPTEESVRKILGGALQIVMGVDELRNNYGTGHGRSEPAKLARRHARLAAGAGMTVATLMLDTLDDPDAPWRRSVD